MNTETAVKLAKPFVGSLTKNPGLRPVLKTALVTEEYVIATNSHILIRVKHHETITKPYLHHYKAYDETYGMDANSYPKGVHKLIPTPDSNTTSGILDTKEMIEAIEGACAVSKENTKALKLKKPQEVILFPEKMEVKDSIGTFETGGYTYKFDKRLPIIDATAFNPEHLKIAFKTFKKEKEKVINAHWISNLRPLFLETSDIEIVILPVRNF